MVVGRRLRQRRQIGHLFEGQLIKRFVEIVQRRRRHAIAAEAKIDFVEIERQNLVLGEGPLHPQRQDGFLDLAVDRHLVGQQEVLCHLLRDGRGPDGPPSGAVIHRVGDNRPRKGAKVNAEMRIKGLVLSRKERLYQARRHRLDRHEDAFFDGMLGNQRTIAGMDACGDRRFVLRQLVMVGKVLAIGPEHPQHRRGGRHRAKKQQAEDNRHKADKAQQEGFLPRRLMHIGKIDRFVKLCVAVHARHKTFRQRWGPYSTR